MRGIATLLSLFRIDAARPEVRVAQVRELERQVPLLYALLSVNSVAIAVTQHGIAPLPLTTLVPALLVLVSMIRFATWLRSRGAARAPALAVAQLNRTVVLATGIALAYISWALVLAAYGGPFANAHIAMFIAITVIGCIFCLMHLPQAALAVTAVVTAPYLLYYFSLGSPAFVVIALNILLVTGVMIQVLLNNYGGFVQLILTRAETERLSRENRRLAHTDALTGLPNRRHFFAELEERIPAGLSGEARFSIGVLDLDRFKPVNDTYGHVVGDRLLEQVAGRLTAAAGPDIVVARLGGDEFGFITPASGTEALAIGQSLCAAIVEPFQLDDLAIQIGCSCGTASFPDGARSVHELFDRADYALYASKAGRRGAATHYSAEHETRVRSDRAIEAALQAADFESEMAIHFQPIVDGETGAVTTVEALARWTSPTLGPVRPDVFIPLAERAGLIHGLTLALFRKALAHLAHLPPEVRLSFNLSAHDLTNPKTVLSLLSVLRQSGVEPARLTFELTETAVMRDFAVAEASIRLLRAPGVKFALDDFGSGYSSLSYLHRLSIDTLKIDRSFLRGTPDASGRALLASIVALSRSMRLECIAEGVEDAEQLAMLRGMGCRGFQGYLFAQPMPAEQMPAWLAANGARAAAPRAAAARRA